MVDKDYIVDDDEDLSIQELEEQDWEGLGGDKTVTIKHEFMDDETRYFRVQEPETDEILNFVSMTPGEEPNHDMDFFELLQAAILAPEITLERWQKMNNPDKVLLVEKVSEATGVRKVTDFIGAGLEEKLAELQSESAESGSSQ